MQTLSPKEIVVALNNLGFTQTDIKNKIGISQASISRIASGKNEDPRLSIVKALEDFYQEVTPNEKA
ncbi:helix-turn-helix transcriptional regulator [Pectobacterium odoriferum]|uniref:helix-turn-helix transcriptional regulator n=1 Tax=Pectobacterium odoriferum TaxID=78398 RepID=UPI000501251F|nr:helix-turn-helix transcriptional regulator [Pectobacterium odoriferum]KGA30249.1 hypothetical protein KS43_20415 [Pectobacterium odoriferum]